MREDDFDIDSLAVYLHLPLAKVVRLADRGKIPGRKVAGRWRFSRAEVHHWLEERIGLSDEGELLEMEDVLTKSAPSDDKAAVSLASLLRVEAISLPMAARSRHRVITEMVNLAAESGMLWDPDKMADAVRAREEMHPTALDCGVAMLHPRRPMPGVLSEACLALGITPGGIPFGGARGVLTDVFFLICSTEDQQHLRMLARLSRLAGDRQTLDAIRAAADAAEVHAIIAEFDEKLA